MPNLLLIESPGKIAKLKQILGDGWIVKASMGHVRELADEGEDALGFELTGTTVQCRYVPRDAKAKKVLADLRQAVKQSDRVLIGCDEDREGEVISWHLAQELRLKNPQRVVYHEITPQAVRQAIAHPRPLDANLIAAGRARDCLDKLVGYKGSKYVVWKLNIGAKSMGRVQSATLHLLCQREREIQVFQPHDFWSVWVDYAEGFRAFYRVKLNATAQAGVETADDTGESTAVPEADQVLSQAEADRLVAIAQAHPHQVVSIEGKIVHQSPPPPFTTSTLQQAAGAKLRFSPDKTMQVAQSLYEKGLITYMRTDSVSLSPEFCQAVRQWLEAHDPANIPKRATQHRSRKGAQEAHEAIRPTDIHRPSAQLRTELSADEFDLYVLIWKRSVASVCNSARLRKTRVITQSGSLYWEARGQIVEFPGYTRYWQNLQADAQLPLLTSGQALTLERSQADKKQTQPPPRYSEPKLVQLMERKGIGRPSTYAPTIKTLKQRGYVHLHQGKLQPTELGLSLDAALEKLLAKLVDPVFTAEMEQALDRIAQGEIGWEEWLLNWNQDYFMPALDQAQTLMMQHMADTPSQPVALTDIPCPQCQHEMARIPSRKVTKGFFLKCQQCNDSVLFWSDRTQQWEQPRSKTVPGQAEPSGKLTSYPCPVCRQPLEEHTYQKDGQQKVMLRCSERTKRQEGKHKDAVYFYTTDGRFWSPKFGDLNTTSQRSAADLQPEPQKGKRRKGASTGRKRKVNSKPL
ncbi:type I DNA topoisomerase [Oculatella sp. LEGE 06141]|uniref:type I DNA topoisomerase n=1 Tax=Oculatella sp. LEGE 06141 TaxID=1828648 RepID=UPI00187F3D99|nr:type I DNA topoisomerase [Oculatella sp. LEGE 06141]MBE9179104.1 type I DNA topoisomerase [Oculatella sp. LEGE 06141]